MRFRKRKESYVSDYLLNGPPVYRCATCSRPVEKIAECFVCIHPVPTPPAPTFCGAFATCLRGGVSMGKGGTVKEE